MRKGIYKGVKCLKECCSLMSTMSCCAFLIGGEEDNPQLCESSRGGDQGDHDERSCSY